MKRVLIVLLVIGLFGAEHAHSATLRDLEKRVAALETGLSDVRRSSPPVGSIIAVALAPEQVKMLEPFWLPADGRVVNDPLSPLNGRTLPDLVARLPLGLAADRDASDNASTTGGSLALPPNMQVSGKTGGMVVFNCTPFQDEAKTSFTNQNAAVWDTPNPESACDHNHSFSGTITSGTPLPLPPYRAVIYLIRVR